MPPATPFFADFHRRLFVEALRTSNAKVYFGLSDAHVIEDVPVEDPGERFAFRFVVSLSDRYWPSAKRLIVQTDRPIPEEMLRYYLPPGGNHDE